MSDGMVIRKIGKKESQKRVAAYCRVSTKHDIQLQSYEEQVEVYTDMIKSNPAWAFAGIYADPGISGTSAEKRPEFMRMITDAKLKKLDYILCKSISRFARNAIEAQKYVNILRENRVVVIFQEEKLRTDDPSSSFIFSLMASVAQDESKSNSENVKWSIQNKYARGEYSYGCQRILGYDYKDGKLFPNKDAWIIKEIFQRFLQGETYREIAESIVKKGAVTSNGNKRFTISALICILRNEVYMGDKRLQKNPPINYLTKRFDKTTNYKSYYIEDDHEPIIDKATWHLVQEKLNRHKKRRSTHEPDCHCSKQ